MVELDDAEPWVAAWTDAARNDTWIAWLHRHARGTRLIDVSAGQGILAVAAARLGAEQVVALSDDPGAVRALARRNRVTVGVETTEERFDVALCSHTSDPLGAMRRLAAVSLAPGGVYVPGRFRLLAALTAPGPLTAEMAAARTELDRIGRTWDLDLGPVRQALDAAEPYRWITASEQVIGTEVEIWDLVPGERPVARTVSLSCDADRAGGVALWWELELDPTLRLHGGPPLVCAWADAVPGPMVRVRFSARGGRVLARPA